MSALADPVELERATDANFDVQRYILANPDLVDPFRDGLDPWHHFTAHGRAEGRMQLAGGPRIAPDARSGGVTLCAIAKNEGRYLIEWVAYHRLMGVERIVIYSNDSGDGSDAVLDRMAAAGLIEHRRWPSVLHRSAQTSAYADAVVRCSTRWILFLDLDEFLNIHGGDIGWLIGRFAPDVSAIGLNWRLFGSSGLDHWDARPVTERFVGASPVDYPGNRHCKTLAVAADIYMVKPHRVRLMRGRYVDASGEPLSPGRGFAPVRHQWVQINHYVIKSRQEFEAKRRRGCVLRPLGDPVKDDHLGPGYFDEHDRNEVEDRSIQSRLPALRAEMARIDRLCRIG